LACSSTASRMSSAYPPNETPSEYLSFDMLTALGSQAGTLQPRARGSYPDTQGAVGEGLGKPEPARGAGDIRFDDAGATGMCCSCPSKTLMHLHTFSFRWHQWDPG
jgi:hypothetical protein